MLQNIYIFFLVLGSNDVLIEKYLYESFSLYKSIL